MTSLTFEGAVEIHGHFTLSNLYGPISLARGSTIASDATLDIPHATQFLKSKLTIDGTVIAPAISSLNIPAETTVSTSGVINASAATQLTVSGNVYGSVNTAAATTVSIASGATVFGTVYSNASAVVTIASGATVSGTLNVPNATTVNIGSKNFYGNIVNNKMTSISLGQTDFGTIGKFSCSKLTDIYIPNKSALPTFYGNYSDHFTAPSKSITVHVYDMTASEIAAMKNSAVWDGFNIVNHKTSVSYTLVNNGGATISFFGLEGNASYVSATGYTSYAQVYSGSKTGTVKGGGNYAVEIRDVDFTTKNAELKRNGHLVSLQTGENQGQPVRFYEDLDLQEDVNYEVTVTDKTCSLTLTQTGYRGNITYTKTTNGTTSSGVIYTSPATITCSQGSALQLSIPYDQYTPQTLTVNGTTYPLTKANGLATATINVPTATSTAGTLTWQEPQQTYETHQPQIMIMRSGEGNVLFKGAICLPEDEWGQYIDDYEQSGLLLSDRGGDATWVISGNGPVSCTQTVTSVTAPDVDPLGEYSLDEGSWGFIIEITPVAGQKLKTLLLGRISNDELSWEDMVSGDYSNASYVTYNASTNTYTFDICGDYMNFGEGDYVVNIAMGPEESAVETGKTLNFVRKGGRGISHIEWYDELGRDFTFGEGSSSRTIPNVELQDDDLKMYIDTEEGETFHVYKDGADITGQFQLNGGSVTQYWAELEEESATYTLLIEESPDANPTWTMLHDGDSIFVDVEYADGTHHEDSFSGFVDKRIFYEPNVSKVTLKVYAENLNDSKPRRILKNGVDVTYQFSTMDDVNGKPGFLLFYEVDGSALVDATWSIGYDTDHRQTFIVNGGTTEQVVEMEFEHLYGSPTIHANNDGVPVTTYLPPYDSEYNSQVILTLNVKNEETLTVLRNGVDVTSAFTKGNGYYEIDATDANYPNLDTRTALGFQINDPATWEITIKSLSDQIKTTTIANPDGMEIAYVYNYANGSHSEDTFTANPFNFNFDDTDRANISSVKMKIPVTLDNNYRPVRVLRNGVDVSYQFEEYEPDEEDGYLLYNVDLNANETWDISYETSHRQTFIRKGGIENAVEVEYDYAVDGCERYYYPDAVGTPLYVDFPTYHDPHAPYAYINIDVEDGKTLKVLRNGVDVTNLFGQAPNAMHGTGYTGYVLDESDYDDNNDGSTPRLGFTFRDPAVWEITIEEAHKMLNAYANNDVYVAIAKVVDGEEPQYVARENSIHQWVNEGETYIVRFTPMHEEELTRFDIGWNPITIEDESRLVRNDDGSYSFTISYNEINEERFDIMAVFEGTGRTMFVTTTGKAYTDLVVNGTRKLCFNSGTKIQQLTDDDTFEVWPCTGTVNYGDAIEKVLLNGTDVTNDATYLKEKVENGSANDYWRYDFSTVAGSAVIQVIYKNARYDTNQDGKVTIADVTKLVNTILGK